MSNTSSLLRYDNPVLVVTTKTGKGGTTKKLPPVETKVMMASLHIYHLFLDILMQT